RRFWASGAQRGPHAGPFPPGIRPARRGPDLPGPLAPVGLPGADQLLSLGGGAGVVRIHRQSLRGAGGERDPAPYRGLERSDRTDSGAPAPGHAPAPVSRSAAREVSVFLSDGSPP